MLHVPGHSSTEATWIVYPIGHKAPAPGYAGHVEWESDVTVGEWLRPRLDTGIAESMHSVVPRGFEAYVRIFHRPWVSSGDNPAQLTTWRAAAEAFGTTMHPLAQWQSLTGTDPYESAVAPDGRTFEPPAQGDLDPAQLAAVMSHLAPSPAPGFAALWNGWGGLLGGYGTSGRSFFTFGETTPDGTDPEVAARHAAMLQSTVRDPFNNVFQEPTWHDGILPRNVSEGPTLDLPGREYVLFRGDVSDFATEDWFLRVPWRDRIAEEHGFEPSAQSPAIVWPADASWAVVSEIDFDSTVVATTAAHAAAILSDPRLEALPLTSDASLTWTGDTINS